MTPADRSSTVTRLRAFIWMAAVNLVAAICLLEIALRVQQKVGPLYDLDLRAESILVGQSDELNHVPLPGSDWDASGIQGMDEPNSPDCAPKLLFMGDSFMHGLGRRDTIPYHVRGFLGRMGADVCVLNAGLSTYAPSIFVPQAKKLIPRLQPDAVVIDVDETDIYDDWYRYRGLATRDDGGSITAVRRTPIISQFQHGLVESTSKALYVHRLLSKLYFTHVEYPKLFARYRADTPEDIFLISRAPAAEARRIYAAQIDYFDATLEDLTNTVLRLTGGPDHLVYIHHPHLEHLKTGSRAFNDIVSATLREVASRHDVRYYDATDDLRTRFGSAPGDYYIPNDMHFNAAGLQAYATAVAKYLAGPGRVVTTSAPRAAR